MKFADIEIAMNIKEAIDCLDNDIINMQRLISDKEGFELSRFRDSSDGVNIQFTTNGDVNAEMYERIGDAVIKEFVAEKQVLLNELGKL